MQANTITLAVDLLNTGSTTNEVFTRHEEQINRSTYIGPEHTVASPNTMQFYRTLPKRSGDYLGSAKVSIKFTASRVVDSATGLDIKAPDIAEVSFSIPVGVTAAQMKATRQRLIAALDSDTVMDALMGTQEI